MSFSDDLYDDLSKIDPLEVFKAEKQRRYEETQVKFAMKMLGLTARIPALKHFCAEHYESRDLLFGAFNSMFDFPVILGAARLYKQKLNAVASVLFGASTQQLRETRYFKAYADFHAQWESRGLPLGLVFTCEPLANGAIIHNMPDVAVSKTSHWVYAGGAAKPFGGCLYFSRYADFLKMVRKSGWKP